MTDEEDALNLYNSDKPLSCFICVSGGSIGPSKLSNTKTQESKT